MSAFFKWPCDSFSYQCLGLIDADTVVANFIFPKVSALSCNIKKIKSFVSILKVHTALEIVFFNSLIKRVEPPMKPPLSPLLIKDVEAQFLMSQSEGQSYLFFIGSPAKIVSVKAELLSLGLREELRGDGSTRGAIPGATL